MRLRQDSSFGTRVVAISAVPPYVLASPLVVLLRVVLPPRLSCATEKPLPQLLECFRTLAALLAVLLKGASPPLRERLEVLRGDFLLPKPPYKLGQSYRHRHPQGGERSAGTLLHVPVLKCCVGCYCVEVLLHVLVLKCCVECCCVEALLHALMLKCLVECCRVDWFEERSAKQVLLPQESEAALTRAHKTASVP